MNTSSVRQLAVHSLIVSVGVLVGSLGVYLVPLQIGVFVDGMSFSPGSAGRLGSIEIAAMATTSMLVSSRMGRWPAGRTAFLGAVFAAACQALTVFVTAMPELSLIRAGVGVGCGFAFAGVLSATSSSTEPDRLMGYGQAIMNIGFMILFILIPKTFEWSMQKGLFYSLMLLLLLSAPVLLRLDSLKSHTPDIAANTAPLFTHGRLVSVHIVATVLLNAGLGALWAFVERIGSNIGLSAEQIGECLSISTMAMIAGSAFAGWLGVKIGRAIPMFLACLLCAGSALAIMSTSSADIYLAGLLVYGAAYLFLGPYVMAGMGAALDPAGRLAPLFGGIMFLSYSIGIWGGGYLVEAVSYEAIGHFACASCLVSAVLYAVNAKAVETLAQ